MSTNIENTTINQRLQKVIDELFLGNKRAFSKAIGVTASVTENIVGKRKSRPSFEIIEKIINSIEDINVEWLMAGRGEMLKNKKPSIANNVDNVAESQANYGKFSAEAKPFIDPLQVSVITPDFFNSVINGEGERITLSFIHDYDFSIRNHGDSMVNKENQQKSIGDNNIVACKIWKDRSFIIWGEVYVLATAERIILRKIMLSEKTDHVKCVSFNEESGYEPFDLHIDSILDMAIVAGVARFDMW